MAVLSIEVSDFSIVYSYICDGRIIYSTYVFDSVYQSILQYIHTGWEIHIFHHSDKMAHTRLYIIYNSYTQCSL